MSMMTFILIHPYQIWRLILFLDVCCHIISVYISTLVLTLCLTIYDIMVTCVLSLMTISACNLFSSISFLLYFSGIDLIHILTFSHCIEKHIDMAVEVIEVQRSVSF